jgi:hypothetical protein
MPYDIHNDDGEMDRTKVHNEVRRIIDHDFAPDEDELISLIDQAIDAAYAEGYADCQDIA